MAAQRRKADRGKNGIGRVIEVQDSSGRSGLIDYNRRGSTIDFRGSSMGTGARQRTTRNVRTDSSRGGSYVGGGNYGGYGGQVRPARHSRKPLIIGIIIVLVIIAAAAFFIVRGCSSGETAAEPVAEEPAQNTAPAADDPRLAVSTSANDQVPGRHVVYLTFDDGPSTNTDRILSILDEYKVKATWFVKANQEELAKVGDIWNAGHQIAIHTYSHDYESIYASADAFWTDINKAYGLVGEALGFDPPKLMRFPGGSFNDYNRSIAETLTTMAGERGWHYFDWNGSCGDGADHTADELVSYALGEAGDKNSCCMLLHDSAAKDTTVEALPRIIEGLQELGYSFEVIVADTYGYHL